MSVIIPAMYFINSIANRFNFIVHKMVFCIMCIQIVYNKNATGFQSGSNGANAVIMLPPCFEIAKTGKEIKNIIKIISPEWQAHVMFEKIEIIALKLTGKSDTVR